MAKYVAQFDNGLKIEFVEMTPEKAREIIAFSESAGFENRRLSSIIVKRYAADMKNGKWKNSGDTIKIADDGVLIDGYHRLHSVISSGVSVNMVIVRGVKRDVFNVLDQGKRRNLDDLLYIDGYRKYTSYIGPAAKQIYYYVMRGEFLTRNNNMAVSYEQIKLVLEYHHEEMIDATQSYLNMQKKGRSILMPSVFISLWILLASIHNQKCVEFMNSIMTGVNLDENDPRLVLRSYLIGMKDNKALGVRDGVYQAAYVVSAWNKFACGQKCQFIRINLKNKFPSISGFDHSKFSWAASSSEKCMEKATNG